MKAVLTTLTMLAIVVTGAVHSNGDEGSVSFLAPFLDDDVLAVGRIDLARLDAQGLIKQSIPDATEAAETSALFVPWLDSLRQAGAREAFVLVVLPELISPSTAPFSVIVPLAEGADAKRIGQLLCGADGSRGPFSWPTCATLHNVVFAGTNEAIDRARQVRPVTRPELAAALAVLGETQAELVLMPSADSRRVLEELLPNLPQALGGEPVTALTRGAKWIAAGLSREEHPRVKWVVQASDAASAQGLTELGKKVIQLVRDSRSVSRFLPNVNQLLEGVRPEIKQDRVSVVIDADKVRTLAAGLFRPMRENVDRSKCANNMKFIGLAMHNYHSARNAFPPAFVADKAGKPLLSWRVLILPYLEQDALFKEFHLDEPWDSPHNRTLIDRIPEVYQCPSARFRLADRGKTTYLSPRGTATAMPGNEGVKISKITDGTSNTIFVVDAPTDRGVIWTKPEDWEVDGNADLKAIFGAHDGGMNSLFVDGSVRYFKDSLKLDVLRKLLTRDGGEVISSEEF